MAWQAVSCVKISMSFLLGEKPQSLCIITVKSMPVNEPQKAEPSLGPQLRFLILRMPNYTTDNSAAWWLPKLKRWSKPAYTSVQHVLKLDIQGTSKVLIRCSTATGHKCILWLCQVCIISLTCSDKSRTVSLWRIPDHAYKPDRIANEEIPLKKTTQPNKTKNPKQ